jgi:phosphoenolpyruvate phosphomutase
MGTRLGGVTGGLIPKGFLKIRGRSLIERSLDNLVGAGISDVLIVTGHLGDHFETLKDKYPVRTVHNKDYAATGSMASLARIEGLVKGTFLLLESDLIYEKRALDRLLSAESDDCILLSGFTGSGDEVYVETSDVSIVNMSKDKSRLASVTGELTGLSKISQPLFGRMLTAFANCGKPQFHYEDALVSAARSAPIGWLKIDDLVWAEIDDLDHLSRVELSVLPKLAALGEEGDAKMPKVYVAMNGDIIHHGHINVIREARKLGDVVVGLLTDEAIAEYQGVPNLSWEQRKTIVENIKGVSEVVPQTSQDYRDTLEKVRPDYVVHGDDWRESIQKGIRDRVIETLDQWGGKVVEVAYTRDEHSKQMEQKLKRLGTTPGIRRRALRRLLDLKKIVRVMEAHNGLTGLIVENAQSEKGGEVREFDAMWVSSLCDSTAKGKPDIELVDMTSRLDTINEIIEVTTKPIILDGDTGGLVEHFVYNVRTLERLGVSAIIIEDKVGLKKNSLFGTDVVQTQDTPEQFAEKIRSGKRAQLTPEFMIIARIESLILKAGIEDALHRAKTYIAAGADGIMIHSMDKKPDEILEFLRLYNTTLTERVPVVVVPTSYNSITEEELQKAGASIVIYANHLIRSAYPAMMKTATSILNHSRSKEADENLLPIKEIITLIPGDY